MAMTDEQRRRAIKLLDDMGTTKAKGLLVSVNSFKGWLRINLPSLYYNLNLGELLSFFQRLIQRYF